MNRTTKMLLIKLSGRRPFFIFYFFILFYLFVYLSGGGVGWGQPIGVLFTTDICSTDIFLICVCFIFILITLLCYLVFLLIGKLVYRSFFPVFQGNTPVYGRFSIGGAYGRVRSILVYNLCLIACFITVLLVTFI